MSRSKARELLMQMVFQMEAQNDKSVYLREKLYEGNNVKASDREYIEKIFDAVTTNLQDIDVLINNASKNWKTDRISKTDLAILRVAIAESLYSEEIPASVAINEAVNMAKKYSSNRSPQFINGVLGKIVNG